MRALHRVPGEHRSIEGGGLHRHSRADRFAGRRARDRDRTHRSSLTRKRRLSPRGPHAATCLRDRLETIVRPTGSWSSAATLRMDRSSSRHSRFQPSRTVSTASDPSRSSTNISTNAFAILDTAPQPVGSVTFGLDGVTYEIDVSKRNAAALRKTCERYIKAGRKSFCVTGSEPPACDAGTRSCAGEAGLRPRAAARMGRSERGGDPLADGQPRAFPGLAQPAAPATETGRRDRTGR